MRVDLRQFPLLLNELVPKISPKDGTLESAKVKELLQNEFEIAVTIRSGDRTYWVEMDDETFTWVSLKWGVK